MVIVVNIDKKQFKNPSNEFRGKPFWSWNGKLEKEELLRQIDVLHEMGMGGYFCHSRTGLETEYLGKEWFELINESSEKGREYGMETWLYDEDRWPSGTAGGMVTENPEFRIHYLRLNVCSAESFAWTDGILAAFSVLLNGQSFSQKRRFFPGEQPESGRTVLYFTSEEMQKYSFYNGFTYVDTMNPEATDRFIELTHEKYAEHCASEIENGSIKGIFTDEPHHGGVMNGFAMTNPEGCNLTPMPKNLFEEFKTRFGYDLMDFLPELYLLKDGEPVSQVKWHYMELLCSLYNENYLGRLQDWCSKNGLQLTGHLLHEDSLSAQAVMNGSLARGYEYMDIPGVDVLWETNPNYQIVKQLQSVARQLGKPHMLSELYGCSGWQMDFAAHKAMGDWQALFGIDLRCHHLSWYTMKGEAKRDYPASIFYQSAWYKEYSYVEDYFARLNMLQQQGSPECDVLVISPVESLWACIRPGWVNMFDAADPTLVKIEEIYKQVFWSLIHAKVDFDFGDEEMLSRLGSIEQTENGPVLRFGKASYRRIVLPGNLTLRSSTVRLLAQFSAAGGAVSAVEYAPSYTDALPSSAFSAVHTQIVPCREDAIIAAVGENKQITVEQNGSRVNDIALQARRTDDGLLMTFMNFNREKSYENVTITVNQGGALELWDVRTGEVYAVAEGTDSVSLCRSFAPAEELVLALRNGKSSAEPLPELSVTSFQTLPDEFEYRLSEPNMLALDMASWRIENEAWQPQEEILKIDRAVRSRLSLPWRSGEMLQPWFKKKNGLSDIPLCSLSLRFTFDIAQLPQTPVELMIETPEEFRAALNGQPVQLEGNSKKWHIDPCFRLFQIPASALKLGENELILTCTYHEQLDLEAVYLVGAFGVQLCGLKREITALPKTLRPGDIAAQGLPFYGGFVDYILKTTEKPQNGRVFLKTDGFDAACVRVIGNGQSRIIGFRPFEADITDLLGGELILRYELTRRNTFGPLHMNPPIAFSYGPGSFVTEGEEFMHDAYSLLPEGMTSPVTLETRSSKK